jgi:hypothetical protein
MNGPMKTPNADELREEDAAQDDADVVDQRSYGLERELLPHQHHRAEDSTGEKKQLAGEQDAGHRGA